MTAIDIFMFAREYAPFGGAGLVIFYLLILLSVRVPPLPEGWKEQYKWDWDYAGIGEPPEGLTTQEWLDTLTREQKEILLSAGWCNYRDKTLTYFYSWRLLFLRLIKLHERFHAITGMPDSVSESTVMAKEKTLWVFIKVWWAAWTRIINGDRYAWLDRLAASILIRKMKEEGR